MYKQSLKDQHVEISLNAIRDFYSQNTDLFDVATDAVIKGCVSQYSFDNKAHKFIGTVYSLDGNGIYDVEITVTNKFEIDATVCNCPEPDICYHIGALALNSGYATPIFSYQGTLNSDGGGDAVESTGCAPQPLQEIYVKCEKSEIDPEPETDTSKDEIIMTAHEFLKLGNKYTKSSLGRSAKVALRQFKAFFGINPAMCFIVWQKLKSDLPQGALPKHLLWCLSFLKQNETEKKRRSYLQCDEKTMRKFTWIIMKALADLDVIKWENRFDGAAAGEICFTSLDGVDFKIVTPRPNDKRWFSHKYRAPGLRYAIALNISNGNIVWAFGGFPCGVFSDQRLAAEKFVQFLGAGELTMADRAYKDETHFILPNADNNTLHKLIMARHETLHKRLKHFKILKEDFRHSLDKHTMIFNAVVNLLQITFQNGEPLF